MNIPASVIPDTPTSEGFGAPVRCSTCGETEQESFFMDHGVCWSCERLEELRNDQQAYIQHACSEVSRYRYRHSVEKAKRMIEKGGEFELSIKTEAGAALVWALPGEGYGYPRISFPSYAPGVKGNTYWLAHGVTLKHAIEVEKQYLDDLVSIISGTYDPTDWCDEEAAYWNEDYVLKAHGYENNFWNRMPLRD